MSFASSTSQNEGSNIDSLLADGLFAAASSEERKYWGFLVFTKVVNEAPVHLASLAFSKNFMRCFMNQLAVEDRYLHRIASKAAKAIQTRVMGEPEFAVLALRGLLGPTGTVNFDQVTKTKTVEKIIVGANSEALKQIIPLLESLIANPGVDDSKAAASSRQHLAGLLHSMVKSLSSMASPIISEGFEESIKEVLLVLARFSYFVADVVTDRNALVPSPPFTQESREVFRNRIMSCLNSLINGRRDPASLPYTVVRSIHQTADTVEGGKLVVEMSGSVRESVDSAFKILKKIAHKVSFTVENLSPALGTLRELIATMRNAKRKRNRLASRHSNCFIP